MTRGLQPPIGLLQSEDTKNVEKLDVNMYFDMLDHLSMEPGYILDYVYLHDETWGSKPVLYSRWVEEPSFKNYSEYLMARGEAAGYDLDQSFLDQVRVDGSDEGFFQFIVLHIMGEQFYLMWHATMNDTIIITDRTSLKSHLQKLESSCHEPTEPLLEQGSAWSLAPRVEFKNDLVELAMVMVGRFGLRGEIYRISQNFPHTIMSQSNDRFVTYSCGISP